uniref:Uncharacterized protein n=1 Tax=Timema bartmani TaxID=61472 RepID=A0A7R9HWH8_9NEOP|nr:unnamed protein product [Timema bartmani]
MAKTSLARYVAAVACGETLSCLWEEVDRVKCYWLALMGWCGFPNEKSVSTETRGHFSTRFSGCLKELSWNKNYIVTDFSHYTGENIGSCDLGHG